MAKGPRGPRKTPTALLKMRGSWRADTLDRKLEIKIPPGRPVMPKWLSPVAKKKWREITPQLIRLGLVTKLDRDILALYCQTYSEYVESVQLRDHTKVIVKDQAGKLILNPTIALMHRIVDRMVRTGAELGLSPASRAGMVLLQKPKEHSSGLEKFQRAQNAS